MTNTFLPAHVSLPVAGRLLGFNPPQALNRYRDARPDEFPNSTARRIALADVEAHPRRQGRKVAVDEYLAADRAEDANRARFRHYNAARKAVATSA